MQVSPAAGARRAMVAAATVVLLLGIVGGAAIDETGGWSHAWRAVSARWRLDVGAPARTEPYPGLDSPPLARLVAVGDVGTGGDAEYATAAAVDRLDAGRDFDALLLLGDNVYPDGDPRQVARVVRRPFAPVLDGRTQLLATLGNHDVETGDGGPEMAALGMAGRWYAQRIGPVEVIAVDSTRADDPAQLGWLERTLTDESAPWTVVIQHHPPLSAGYHGSHGPSDRSLVPLYERYGVDLVLAGHDHDYQRTKPQHGVVYVVSGAAAKRRPTARPTSPRRRHRPTSSSSWPPTPTGSSCEQSTSTAAYSTRRRSPGEQGRSADLGDAGTLAMNAV